MAISKIPNTGRQIMNVRSQIAIVANGNTAPQSIAAGQYVLWNDELYTANAAIASGAALSENILTPVAGGGLNHIKSMLRNATSSSAGLMSAADKAKLDAPETIIFPSDRTLLNSAGFHNSVWRGQSLGSSLTSAQSAAITGGTFADLFLGDYWTINGVTWRIMGFDVFLSCGDNFLPSHHVVVVPDTNLYKCKWNETANTTDGGPNGGIGYAGSFVRANIKSSVNGEAEGAELKVIAAFGNDHVLSYRTIYPSAYDAEGNATTFANFDARVELMSEIMVYGSQIFTAHGIGNGYEAGIEKTQLPGFRVNPRLIKSADYWLRNPFTKTSVCEVGTYGNATRTNANAEKGVRPFALIA